MMLHELLKTLQLYDSEIGAPGTPPHGSFKGDISFYLDDEDCTALEIKEIEPRQALGCGCWTGVSITMKVKESNG